MNTSSRTGTTAMMPTMRQLFINLRVDIFGSGLKKHKKPVFEARTYHYTSSSTWNSDHGTQILASPSPSSKTSESAVSSSQVSDSLSARTRLSISTQDGYHMNSIPGSWPDEELVPAPTVSLVPSYQQNQRSSESSDTNIEYPAKPPVQIIKGRNIVYIKPTTLSNGSMVTRRHLRSGNDILVVHHPTPGEICDEMSPEHQHDDTNIY